MPVILRLLKYIILALVLWGLPSFFLAYFNAAIGSALSELTFVVLGLFYLLCREKGTLLLAFLSLGLSYFIIAGFNYSGNLSGMDYYTMVIKYLLVIIAGAEVLRKTSMSEVYYFLMIGSLSIIIHTLFFPLHNASFGPTYGRFSGFYLNPNYGGAISLIGFALTFGVKEKRLRYLGFFIFTLGGVFTFSRYFLGMWVVLNILSVFVNRKNLVFPVVGIMFLLIIFAFGSSLQVNTERFNAIGSIFSGEETQVDVLQENSRTETWASYTDVILNEPIFGNGFKKMQGNHFGLFAGVHNTYLLVIGEAGVLPFIILVGIYCFMLKVGYQRFKTNPHQSMLALVLFTALLVTHNYFDRFSLLFVSMYLYLSFTEPKSFSDSLESGSDFVQEDFGVVKNHSLFKAQKPG